jgi:3-hydroxyacyl-CoA dehydrogenase/enoyl-CoA hydratase/3-hydroxybutyryl-CoA epimerase
MKPDNGNYRHWKMNLDGNGILWLSLERADSEINTLSREVLRELEQLLEDIRRQEAAGVVIRSAKKNGFIAGADITEFSSVTGSSEALELVEWVHGIFDRLEQLSIPVVCVINGFCLGGGLELALACRYRIVIDSPGARLGLPEVRLGIHPGFGGTVRLIRQVGPRQALSLMLSGRSIRAGQARRIGLVDYVVPERQWKHAVREVISHPPAKRKPRFLNTLFRLRLLRSMLASYLRRMVAKRVIREHYPAPYALIDLWERFGGNQTVMYREESRSVADLVVGTTSRNLARVFSLQERIRNQGRMGRFAPRSIHVIGGGTMGGDIAAWCALQGLRVTIQDVEQERLAAAFKRAAILFQRKLKKRRLVEDALDRFIPDIKGDGISRADVVIEAIFEDASVKRELYQQVEPRMRRDALLATNTSSIPLEVLAEPLQYPERFVGLHFFNPVAKMQLVEVVRGKAVETERFNDATGFVSAIRRLPLQVASSPGFLINRILTPYLMEAFVMEQQGVPAEDIDRAALEFGMPMGPILLADSVGLDICLSVGRILSGHFNIEIPERLETLVAAGRLGKKSGSGFYNYKKGRRRASKGKMGGSPHGELAERLILRLLNEAIACLRERIVPDADLLDAGTIFGTGFAPFRGGPLHYIRSSGVNSILARLEFLKEHYGERFTPDQGWHALKMQLTKLDSV